MAHPKLTTDTHYGKFCRMLIHVLLNPTDKCVEWPYGKDKDGYGHFTWWNKTRNAATTMKVPRLAFFFAYGYWPNPNCLHSCDNPPCFNPDHLRAGTTAENVQEMHSKGRAVNNRGTNCGAAKLTDHNVREIRTHYAAGRLSQYQLAARYEVSRTVIEYIVTGRTWKHVV
jgi:hypothetical protein